MVRVVQGDKVTELPCSNTKIKTIKGGMRQLFGRCEFTLVETQEMGGLETRTEDNENG